jgi:CDP-diglyceride synthetase
MATTITATATKVTSNKWHDIPVRIATISVGIPILWIVWSHTWSRIVFFQGLHIVLSFEWIRIVHTNQQKLSNDDKNKKQQQQQSSSSSSSSFLWITPIISLVLANISNDNHFITLLVVYTGLVTVLFPNQKHIPVAVLQSLMLITIPLRTWLTLTSNVRYGFVRTITLLFTAWNCDTGALLAGRYFKSTLSPSEQEQVQNIPTRTNTIITTQQTTVSMIRSWLKTISPNKSMEGLFGGIGLGVFTYVVVRWIWLFLSLLHILPLQQHQDDDGSMFSSLGIVNDICIGISLSICAIIGDLWESSLKRQYLVKDSGKLLPGHGGILDRFDSSLVAVIVYTILLDYRQSSSRPY